MSPSPLPIVVLISGSGTNLQAIIDAINAGKINADIRAVISNRPGVQGLERASNAGIHTEVLEHHLPVLYHGVVTEADIENFPDTTFVCAHGLCGRFYAHTHR